MKQNSSPYDPPKSPLETDPQKPLEVVPASHGLRIVNLIIDYIAIMIFGGIIGVIIALLWGQEGILYLESLPELVVGVTIAILYYILFESLTDRTLGKLISGTKVVNYDGLRPSFGQILGRTFCRLIPFEAFTFLFNIGYGLHDRLPKTFVVKCR